VSGCISLYMGTVFLVAMYIWLGIYGILFLWNLVPSALVGTCVVEIGCGLSGSARDQSMLRAFLVFHHWEEAQASGMVCPMAEAAMEWGNFCVSQAEGGAVVILVSKVCPYADPRSNIVDYAPVGVHVEDRFEWASLVLHVKTGYPY
jgi:hypothetical protein